MLPNRLALVKQSLADIAPVMQPKINAQHFLAGYVQSGLEQGNIIPRVQAMIDSNRYSLSNLNPYHTRGSEYVVVHPRDEGNVNVVTMDELQQLIQGLKMTNAV